MTRRKRGQVTENFENGERRIIEGENKKYEHQPAPDHFPAQTESPKVHHRHTEALGIGQVVLGDSLIGTISFVETQWTGFVINIGLLEKI